MSAEFRIDILIQTNQVGCFLGCLLDVSKFELCTLHWSYLAGGPTMFYYYYYYYYYLLLLLLLLLLLSLLFIFKPGKLAW